jgi:adenylylsulfate kinase-like enzyme
MSEGAPIVWIAGRPAAGKTTLGRAMLAALAALATRGPRGELIDSDEVRAAITPAPTYADDERRIVYRSMAYLAGRLAARGVPVIVAATAHRRALRQAAGALIPTARWIWLDCSLEEATRRDPKGLYASARAGASSALPGLGEAIEPPASDEDVEWIGTDAAGDPATPAALVARLFATR